MPPSPVMRISPRRELRVENHNRGRSLESGIFFREKDDDLALFNEVQNKETDNFLLQSNDDFDDIFSSKLRHFSGNKLGVSIPAQGESSDLLNAEGDKNDYDWLITPPETPLFPSLDDKAPSASLAPRGRPRSQPITISRSSTMEKGYRSSRGSASPHRLSPSPPSTNSTLQSRSRPFSTTHSSPPPSRKLSPSPSKHTPAPRTRTPTPPRRMSTGTASTQLRARGTSPVKPSHGNSASPKTRGWESTILGFSSEAPPNLRTSLANSPSSYVRGSSPASRNGFRSGRQSMSPTVSRRSSSCHSQERDQFSSHSKGSVVLSGDDDVDSLQSNPSSGERSVPRSVGAYPNSRTMGFSKKANKVLSSSAPKRSLDLTLRQMEKKAPQNMFRPLLSGVPSTTFYAGKESAHHHILTSRNSSNTTGSNASSDQGMSGALDNQVSERTDPIHEDMNSEIGKGQYPIPHEIFVMDQTDAIENRVIMESSGCSHGENVEPPIFISDVVLDRESDTDGNTDMESCSKCCRIFNSGKLIKEGDMWLCSDCRSTEMNSTALVLVRNNTTGDIAQILECESSQFASTSETEKGHLDSKDLAISSVEEKEVIFAKNQEINQSVGSNTDVSEGRGISLLLKRSSSGKGHIVQSRSFTASNVSYEDFSYAKDSVYSTRSSIGYSGASTSSSADLGSSRQTEKRIHRQLSGPKSDMERCRHETTVNHRRSVSSVSGGALGHVLFPTTTSCLGDSLEATSVNKEKETERSMASELTDAGSICTDIENSMMFNTATDFFSEEIPLPENGDDLTNISGHSEISAENSISISTREDDGVVQSTCVEGVDGSEVPQTSSLDSISEVEIKKADIVSDDPHSDAASKSCTDELSELSEGSYSMTQNDVTTATIEEFEISVDPEELEDTKHRGFSLEEATDAILFCSSIVHRLAYEAADIAAGKDTLPEEGLRPAVTVVGKSISERRDIRSRRRISKSQKGRQRKLDPDTKQPHFVVAESDEKPAQRIVKSPSKGDSVNPPKLESKCNCTIM